jgi:excisionase family DNA binding protein
MMESLLTASEVASILRLSRNAVYKLLRRGVIPAVDVSGVVREKRTFRVSPGALQRWIAGQSPGDHFH